MKNFSKDLLFAVLGMLFIFSIPFFTMGMAEDSPPGLITETTETIIILDTSVAVVPALAPIPETTEKGFFLFTEFKPATEKDRAVVSYIGKVYDYARGLKDMNGQPTSVKMAQAILESDSGNSFLAIQANNHFGIKCFSKTCKKGHCVNKDDDHHKDFFRSYKRWEHSFIAHSNFLLKKRYADCLKLKKADEWCDCLQAKGYATSKTYSSRLKSIIDKYRLHEFD